MKNMIIIGLAASLMSLLATPAMAGEAGVEVEFSSSEAAVIRAYYREQQATQKPKSKQGKGLPPGIARNLQRGKPLPPGIAKQALPSGLIAILPPPPRGYERLELAGKILLVEVATQIIHDVLEDAVLRK